MPILPLSAQVQTYAWGKLGEQSKVASLAIHACPGLAIHPSQTYAEVRPI